MHGISEIISFKVLIKLTIQDDFAFLRTRLTATNYFDFCIVLCIYSGENSLFSSSSWSFQFYRNAGKGYIYKTVLFQLSAENWVEHCSHN